MTLNEQIIQQLSDQIEALKEENRKLKQENQWLEDEKGRDQQRWSRAAERRSELAKMEGRIMANWEAKEFEDLMWSSVCEKADIYEEALEQIANGLADPAAIASNALNGRNGAGYVGYQVHPEYIIHLKKLEKWFGEKAARAQEIFNNERNP